MFVSVLNFHSLTSGVWLIDIGEERCTRGTDICFDFQSVCCRELGTLQQFCSSCALSSPELLDVFGFTYPAFAAMHVQQVHTFQFVQAFPRTALAW